MDYATDVLFTALQFITVSYCQICILTIVKSIDSVKKENN